MKPAVDSERLLDEVFDESTDLRAQSMDRLLRETRRHRQRRRAAQVAGLVAGIIVVVSVLLKNSPPPGPASPDLAPSLPLPGSALLVRSAPLPAAMLIESSPTSIEVIRSAFTSIPQLETPRDTAFFREISDGELFALLDGRPAALVRLHSGRKELLLLDE